MWRKGWIDDEGAEVDLCNACGARRARDETKTKTRRRRADDDAREKRLTRARSNRRFDFQARVVVRVVRVAVSQSG